MPTGTLIRHLREQLGMTVAQFAALMGVHVASVYRWEAAGSATLSLDPLQAMLLQRLQHVAAQRAAERKKMTNDLVEAVLVGGTLAGLAVLLADLVPKALKK